MDKLLSDQEVLKIIGGKAKLVTNPELAQYSNIKQLFDGNDKVVLLYVNDIDGNSINGHWCLLTKVKRDGKTIVEFNDPYGLKPDEQLKYYSKDWKKESGQDGNFLTRLLYDFSLNPKHEVHYNESVMQEDDKEINTCGRHIGLRGHFYKIPLKTYQSIFKKLEEDGYDLDEVAVELTDNLM